MDRLFPKLKDAAEDAEVRRTLNRMYDMIADLQGRLSTVESKPVQLSGEQQQSIARDAVSLIGVLAQPLIGSKADPLLSSVPQSPGTGTVTSVGQNNSVSGLTMTISNPTSTPVINLSGTPNIAASNVTSGQFSTARLPNTINISTAYQIGGVQVVGAQGALVADAAGGATIDAEARTAINTALARLRTHGLIAT